VLPATSLSAQSSKPKGSAEPSELFLRSNLLEYVTVFANQSTKLPLEAVN